MARFPVLPLAFALAVGVAGCTAGDEPEERREAVVRIVDALGLEPMPGDDAIAIHRTQSKSDYPYYSAEGVLNVRTREAGLRRSAAALEREGFDVFESGDVAYSLGACARGRQESMIARLLAGWHEAEGFNPYPRLPGKVYVAVSVGHVDSNQAWTDTERPDCGA